MLLTMTLPQLRRYLSKVHSKQTQILSGQELNNFYLKIPVFSQYRHQITLILLLISR